MENLMSTPIASKKWQSLDSNEPMENSNIDDNEQDTPKNKLTRSDSPFFDNISPIDRNINQHEVVTYDHDFNEEDTIVYNDPLQNNETSCELNNSSTSISPIDRNLNKHEVVMSDHDFNEEDTIVYNDPLQNNETSCELNNSSTSIREFDNYSTSDSCSEVNYSFCEEVDVDDVNEIIMEMSQAIHKYISNIKKLDISVEWELPKTLIAKKGFRKSKSGLKGPLESSEVSFIKKRLKQFCEEYDINYGAIRASLADKISRFRFPNELRLKFVQYLCKDFINDRNPMTVFRAISKLGLRKGKFSEGEEKFLADMYHSYKGSHLHSVCGLILNRHRNHIFKKIERLKNKNSLGSRPSSHNVKIEPLQLRKLILKDILSRRNYDLKRLKSRLNTRSWQSIGRVNNVSPAVAKAIYLTEIFPQIFAVHPVKFHKFFSKMLYSIKSSDWEEWEDVKWKDLSTVLYDVGPVFVYVMLRKIIMHCVPKEKWNNFKECAEYLHQNVLPYFENEPIKTALNRIFLQQVEENDLKL